MLVKVSCENQHIFKYLKKINPCRADEKMSSEVKFAWQTKIPKIRQAISNVRFYLELDSTISSEEKEKIIELVDLLWKSILDEVDENELKEVKE